MSVFFTKFYGGYFTLESNLHRSGMGHENEVNGFQKAYYEATDILLFFLYNYCTKIRNLG